MTQLRAVLSQRKQFGQPQLPLLGVSLDAGVRARWSDDGRPAPSQDLDGYKVVHPDDIVMNALGKPHGSIGRSQSLGITSPAYWVLVPDERLDPQFAHYLLRSSAMVSTYQHLGKNQPPNQFDISWESFRSIEVWLPDLSTQRRIADYVDAECARLDRLIELRSHHISLVQERASAELDSIMGSKDVPAVRLGRLATIQSGITVDAGRTALAAEEVPYLRVANVQVGKLDLTEVKTIAVAPDVRRRYLLRDGDVLMTEGGDLDKLGRGTVWRCEIDGAIHQNHVFAVRPRRDTLLPEYLAYATAASPARRYFESTGNKTTNLASTSSSKVLDFRLPLLTLAEQQAVIDQARESARHAEVLADSMRRSVGLVRERKQALITAAVTGQFDVSAASGRGV